MLAEMFARQKTGSVVCASCGSLVGVNDEQCYSCGRRNPGLWGFGPMLRRFGNDLGFVSLVVYGCSVLYALTLIATVALGGAWCRRAACMNFLSPGPWSRSRSAPAARCRCSGYGMWWTVLSAGWLHGSALHILFNMLWVRQLGPATADVYGAGRMVIIYTVSSVDGLPPQQHRRTAVRRAADPVPRAAPRSHSVRPRRSSGCSARWCTTGGVAAAA